MDKINHLSFFLRKWQGMPQKSNNILGISFIVLFLHLFNSIYLFIYL